MKRILVTTLLLSCLTLVGCNPVTMKITASDDLSNINVEVDGFSLENITMQNASMQTPVVLGSTTQNTASNNQSNDVTGQNTTTQSAPASNETAQTSESNTTVQNNVTNTQTTDNMANNAATTQVQTKDSYGVFKDIVTNHLTAYDNIHSIELNPAAVDFSFVSSVNNDWARVDKAIVVKHSAGKVFLVLGYDAMSADYVVEVYEVSGDVPTYCSTATNVRVISYDPNEKTFGTEVTVNVLGTYWVGMVHELKDNGEFAVKGNIYTMDTSYNVERHTLTVTKELPVWMEGGNTTLQPGTKIIIDGASTWNEMFFKVAETGEGGYITYELDAEGRVMINGVSEAEYFEVLPYTG